MLPDQVSPAGSMLASNADRERVVDVLRAGFTEGRLTQEEFSERVARAYESRTYGQLGQLTADLPAGPLPVPQPVQPVRPVPPTAGYGPPAPAWPAPSAAGLVVTALLVFALAALVTSVAFLLHAHGHPGPFPHTQLEPFIQYHHPQ